MLTWHCSAPSAHREHSWPGSEGSNGAGGVVPGMSSPVQPPGALQNTLISFSFLFF